MDKFRMIGQSSSNITTDTSSFMRGGNMMVDLTSNSSIQEEGADKKLIIAGIVVFILICICVWRCVCKKKGSPASVDIPQETAQETDTDSDSETDSSKSSQTDAQEEQIILNQNNSFIGEALNGSTVTGDFVGTVEEGAIGAAIKQDKKKVIKSILKKR